MTVAAGSSKTRTRELEDRKDIELARRVKKAGGRVSSIADVRKKLGLSQRRARRKSEGERRK